MALAVILLATGSFLSANDFLSNPPAAAARARVVSVQNPQATDAYLPRTDILQAMMDRAITTLVGKPDAASAWGSLVTTQDVVGIKVFSAPGQTAGTRPAVVAAIVQGLLAAKLPPRNIVIWDRRMGDLQNAGYGALADRLGVRLSGCVEGGYDAKVVYESPLLGTLLSGDLEFNSPLEKIGRKSHVAKLVSQQLTKVISVAPLLNNYDVGVVGNLYSVALGSVDNTRRFENSSDALARAVPEIYALPAVGDRVVLSVTDALICQFEGGGHVRLQNATVPNELRVSRDPVALDVLATRELAAQRMRAGFDVGNTNYVDLYQNAALLELGVSDVKRIDVETVR